MESSINIYDILHILCLSNKSIYNFVLTFKFFSPQMINILINFDVCMILWLAGEFECFLN